MVKIQAMVSLKNEISKSEYKYAISLRVTSQQGLTDIYAPKKTSKGEYKQI